MKRELSTSSIHCMASRSRSFLWFPPYSLMDLLENGTAIPFFMLHETKLSRTEQNGKFKGRENIFCDAYCKKGDKIEMENGA